MAGMIQQQMAQGGMSPQGIRSRLNIPANLKNAYDRIILAGMKVMFDPKTHDLMLKSLNGPGPIDQKLGKGVADLMGILFEQSNKTMPPQLIIPAGIELLAHAVDFLRKSGQDVTDEQFGSAVQLMMQTLLSGAGVNMDKLAEFADKGQAGAAAAQPASLAPQEGA